MVWYETTDGQSTLNWERKIEKKSFHCVYSAQRPFTNTIHCIRCTALFLRYCFRSASNICFTHIFLQQHSTKRHRIFWVQKRNRKKTNSPPTTTPTKKSPQNLFVNKNMVIARCEKRTRWNQVKEMKCVIFDVLYAYNSDHYYFKGRRLVHGVSFSNCFFFFAWCLFVCFWMGRCEYGVNNWSVNNCDS